MAEEPPPTSVLEGVLSSQAPAPAENQPLVRTRGPIRPLRAGGLAAAAQGGSRWLRLGELVEELRLQVGKLPLTIIIHGQGTAAARDFLDSLLGLVHPGDALWLTAQDPIATPADLPTLAGMVILDLRHDQDLRLYRNLISDLVFFSASEEGQVSLATLCRRRARAVVIDRFGKLSDRLFAAVEASAELPPAATGQGARTATVCLWYGTEKLEAFSPAGQPAGSLPRAADPEAFGTELKRKALLLEREHDRRLHFRALIESLRLNSAAPPSLDEDLIRQADLNGWPAWAVQSIGPLYVPLAVLPNGRHRALAWFHLLGCVGGHGQYWIQEKLCNGQMMDVLLAPDAARLWAEIDRTFQESVPAAGFSSDRAFFGLVAHALREVELRSATSTAAALGIRATRESILRQSGVL